MQALNRFSCEVVCTLVVGDVRWTQLRHRYVVARKQLASVCISALIVFFADLELSLSLCLRNSDVRANCCVLAVSRSESGCTYPPPRRSSCWSLRLSGFLQLITRQRFRLDRRSLPNTNRKSYFASEAQPSACCSEVAFGTC